MRPVAFEIPWVSLVEFALGDDVRLVVNRAKWAGWLKSIVQPKEPLFFLRLGAEIIEIILGQFGSALRCLATWALKMMHHDASRRQGRGAAKEADANHRSLVFKRLKKMALGHLALQNRRKVATC
jgi:hypothetical protein